jgi:hypothetical protein
MGTVFADGAPVARWRAGFAALMRQFQALGQPVPWTAQHDKGVHTSQLALCWPDEKTARCRAQPGEQDNQRRSQSAPVPATDRSPTGLQRLGPVRYLIGRH